MALPGSDDILKHFSKLSLEPGALLHCVNDAAALVRRLRAQVHGGLWW